ncbi:formyltransferase family protein [Salicola sp. Rm-C-2C1-2]|uniref:methionyl-tRNA formyltransferase n=1 Tax=Salicola sp. Rm-C-2C1-2 TaxID=3141321 RepID=UPI0032E5190A
MRIAVFGYSHFTRHCIQALQQLGHRIELFCPREDEAFLAHYGLTELGLPVHWFETTAAPAWQQALVAFEPDLVLSIIFNHRLPESVTQQARLGALNVHPAPLPAVRTAAVWYWPLRLGLAQSEVCIHHLTSEMDQGPVVLRFPFRLHRAETQGTLTRRLNALAPKVMHALNGLLASGAMPQGEPQGTGTTYPPLREEALWIDFSNPTDSVRNQVRACTPYHPAQAVFRGEVIAIHELGDESVPAPSDCSLGELRLNEGLWVRCGAGMVAVTILAVPGAGVFSGERFAALFRVENGESLAPQ